MDQGGAPAGGSKKEKKGKGKDKDKESAAEKLTVATAAPPTVATTVTTRLRPSALAPRVAVAGWTAPLVSLRPWIL